MKSGRPAESDEAKRARGTFDPRYSADARAERAEQKVVALFGGDPLKEIPDPPDALHQKAKDEYFLWARTLHQAGRLTQIWLDKVLNYALRKHSTLERLAQGKLPKDGDLKACELFLKEIGALNVDAPRIGQEPVKSKWGRIGFASGVRAG